MDGFQMEGTDHLLSLFGLLGEGVGRTGHLTWQTRRPRLNDTSVRRRVDRGHAGANDIVVNSQSHEVNPGCRRLDPLAPSPRYEHRLCTGPWLGAYNLGDEVDHGQGISGSIPP